MPVIDPHMPVIKRADVWVLLGPHRGDNHQVLALVEGLGVPFRSIQLRYRWFAHVPAALRRVAIAQLTPEARAEIAPPWPSLVLGIGQRSAPVARYIKRASGGRTTIVRLGDPMVSPRLFDLVVTTTQYAVREAENVVRLPITLTSPAVAPDRAEQQWLAAFPEPRRLMVVGGATSLWRLKPSTVAETARTLKCRAMREGGSVMAVTSPRTSGRLGAAARAVLGSNAVVEDDFPRYRALISAADEIHVTGDSVSMLSEAIAAHKPVGLIPLDLNPIGKLLRIVEAIRGRPFRIRDLAKFWNDLRARKLVGSVEEPRRGNLDADPLETALGAVRAAMDGRLPGTVVRVKIPPARRAPPQPAVG